MKRAVFAAPRGRRELDACAVPVAPPNPSPLPIAMFYRISASVVTSEQMTTVCIDPFLLINRVCVCLTAAAPAANAAALRNQ